MSTWLKKQCYFNMFIVPIHNFWLPGYDSEEGWSDPYDLNLDPSLLCNMYVAIQCCHGHILCTMNIKSVTSILVVSM